MKGFLGTDAPFMMDFVVVALVAVIPALMYSIACVKKGNIERHKNVQIALAIVLLITVTLFEIEIRLADGIDNLMQKSIYYESLAFDIVLNIHLVFAVSTPLLWAWTIFAALKKYENRVFKDGYGKKHKLLGAISIIDLLLTSVTGLVVYYMAFMCIN
jgi:putative membrane protein